MSILIWYCDRTYSKLVRIIAVTLCVVFTACTDVTQTTVDKIPLHELRNEKGAIGAYNATIYQFRTAFTGMVIRTGFLTDELESGASGLDANTIGAGWDPVDARMLDNDSDRTATLYTALHSVRSQGEHAQAALKNYAPLTPPALRGHLTALRGYAVLFLADAYCSGVPLSTVDFEGDFSYKGGATTEELYMRSIQLFDSAITLSQDSIRFVNLARVGKARAWLALGEYDSAVSAAASVDSGFSYQVLLGPANVETYFGTGEILASVSDGEGVNGLPFVTSADPRSAASFVMTNRFGKPLYRPNKISRGNVYTATLANWVEARLIAAEHALRSGSVSQWLDTLNMLRSTLGSSLPPLADPEERDLRLALTFDERGYWLFLTAHRQGDLRRRVRNDGIASEQVYPVGPYFGGVGSYGQSINFLINEDENTNPLFQGCKGRDA